MSQKSGCCGGQSHPPSEDQLRKGVRDAYSKVATANTAGQSHAEPKSCCGTSSDEGIQQIISTRLGYSEADIGFVPQGANMGLGCGNPRAIASLTEGETVLDLGSGGGFDCFLASAEVGPSGQVIGVDMTPEMVSKARANAQEGHFTNVRFRLGEIEHLPVADQSVDVIISNCVINLSPNKDQVFREAFRVLKPNGRLAISDVVATIALPKELREDPALIAGCMGNAALIADLSQMMRDAGFVNITIEPKDASREFIKDWAPGSSVSDYVLSATIEARKPRECARIY